MVEKARTRRCRSSGDRISRRTGSVTQRNAGPKRTIERLIRTWTACEKRCACSLNGKASPSWFFRQYPDRSRPTSRVSSSTRSFPTGESSAHFETINVAESRTTKWRFPVSSKWRLPMPNRLPHHQHAERNSAARSRRCRILVCAILPTIGSAGCRDTAPATPTAIVQSVQATADDPCHPGEGAPVLFDGNYVRGAGQPAADERSFASGGRSSAAMCVEAKNAPGGVVEVNGAVVLGPSDFQERSFVRTVYLPLVAENTVSVELRGPPCMDPGPPACASLRLRLFGGAPLQARVATGPDACCHDPACDKEAFAARGGICPGDPRISGALPHEAPAATAQ